MATRTAPRNGSEFSEWCDAATPKADRPTASGTTCRNDGKTPQWTHCATPKVS